MTASMERVGPGGLDGSGKSATRDGSGRDRPAMLRRDMPLLLIGLGGSAGAIARYLVDGAVAERAGGGFPWGTLVAGLAVGRAI